MKKILLLLLLSSFLVIPAWATDYTADANCERAYLFKEGSGETVDNAEGTAARDGTFQGAGEPAWSADVPAGYSDYSTDYDGLNDRITAPDPSLTNSMTLVAWGKSDTPDFSFSHLLSYHPGVFISGNNNTKNMRFSIVTGGEVSVNFDTFTNIGTGWVHYAGIYNEQAGDDIETFLNGVSKNTAAQSGNIDTTGNFNVGNYWNTSTASNAWDGHITQTAIFSRALTSTEINDIMDNGLAPVAGGRRRIIMVN